MEKHHPNSRMSLRTRIFHGAFTCHRNLPELFHELNPEIENYHELDYQILDVEPVTNPAYGDSICFIASDEDYNHKITLIIASSNWSRSYFFNLLFMTLRYIKDLSRKLYVEDPLQLSIDICFLYVGTDERTVLDMNWGVPDEIVSTTRVKFIPEILTFRTVTFDGEEPGENELSSLFYQYWRFIQILEMNKEKYPMSMKGFFETFKQCEEEHIFPRYFKKRKRGL